MRLEDYHSSRLGRIILWGYTDRGKEAQALLARFALLSCVAWNCAILFREHEMTLMLGIKGAIYVIMVACWAKLERLAAVSTYRREIGREVQDVDVVRYLVTKGVIDGGSIDSEGLGTELGPGYKKPFPSVDKPVPKGRNLSEAWPDFVAELVSYIREVGLPEGVGHQGQSEIFNEVSKRLAASGKDEIGRTQAQETINAVLRRARLAGKPPA